MRWLIRLLLLWAISGVLFYVVALPMLVDRLGRKAQKDAYNQCKATLMKESLIGSATSPMKPEQGEKYCHCVGDGLILTQKDVFDLARHRPTTDLAVLSERLSDTCTTALQREMYPTPPATPAPAPAPGQPDADGLIHL